LFDSLLVFENYPVSKLINSKKWSLQVENLEVTAQNNYPLTLDIGSSDELRIHFTYNTDLLERGYVTAIRDQFEQVLLQITNGLASKLGDIRVITASQQQTLMEEFNIASPELKYQEMNHILEDDNDDNIISF
jgi:non-ribosomal peptide synthetase component F